MTDRPILFSGPMVRALLDGRKTQTRRVLNPQPPADMGLVGIYAPKLTAVFGYETPDADHKVMLRYMPGDRLWVRESGLENRKTRLFIHDATPGRWWTPNDGGRYGASYSDAISRQSLLRDHRVRPSIHMPRWASRLTLTVTDVRVQRLQEITPCDCLEEGILPQKSKAREDFQDLWDSINAARGFGWDANPWVAAVSFTVDRRNIDQVQP